MTCFPWKGMKFALTVGILLLSYLCPTQSSAECPEGLVEVVIGGQNVGHVLCVEEQAAEQLELDTDLLLPPCPCGSEPTVDVTPIDPHDDTQNYCSIVESESRAEFRLFAHTQPSHEEKSLTVNVSAIYDDTGFVGGGCVWIVRDANNSVLADDRAFLDTLDEAMACVSLWSHYGGTIGIHPCDTPDLTP